MLVRPRGELPIQFLGQFCSEAEAQQAQQERVSACLHCRAGPMHAEGGARSTLGLPQGTAHGEAREEWREKGMSLTSYNIRFCA